MSDLPAVPEHTKVDRRRSEGTLKGLDDLVDRLASDADRLADDGDYLGLGDGLGRLRGIIARLRDLERHIEDHTAPLLPSKLVIEDGIGMERKQSTIRKQWQSTDLLRHLVGDTLVNPETGESVYETLVACVPFTGSLGWRVTALRDRGVQLDEWCQEEPGRTSVRVWRESDDG